MKSSMNLIHRLAGWGQSTLLLTLGSIILSACSPAAQEDQAPSSSQDEASQSPESKDTSQGSPELSKLPRPKSCKRFAPDIAFPDSNPNSKSYKEELSPKDYRGEVSLWISTFDCDC